MNGTLREELERDKNRDKSMELKGKKNKKDETDRKDKKGRDSGLADLQDFAMD